MTIRRLLGIVLLLATVLMLVVTMTMPAISATAPAILTLGLGAATFFTLKGSGKKKSAPAEPHPS